MAAKHKGKEIKEEKQYGRTTKFQVPEQNIISA